ncbi:MAG: ATP-binding cassette domain-containing protein [Promethearchaeota archaeon]|nr:MAG: ATP-binding cassette domain-containing protein [Candidatus Lokiarchaeota archaeon]
MTENNNIIEVKNLTKIYEEGNVLAVDDISFNIKKGEIFALLGPNGAGKTTTISVLATLLSSTNGETFVNNYDVSKDPDKVRKSIGIVFQEPSLDGEMKAWENLELHGILYGMPKKERQEKIKEVLKLVDLDERADTFVKNYSGGMKRRLEIARGLLHEPKVLFLDEPTLGLDPQTRRKIWDKIKELNKSDTKITILITTHYMDEADELADRICIMDHGKIIAMDTSENLKKQLSGDVIDIQFENLEEMFKLPITINQIKDIPGVKNVTMGSAEAQQDIMPNIKLPKGMPNIDPAMIQARIRETLSDPKKLIEAWKRMPMTTGMFLNAPLAMKKKIANMFDDKLLEEVPDTIKQEMIKIKKGELEEKEVLEPSISISCESGGQQLPLIIRKINENGLKIKTVNMHEPTLEDVFLHYVGKTIREETSNHTKDIKKMIQMRQLRKG